MGKLAPDLAFRVLKELTVKELVGVRAVRLRPRLLCYRSISYSYIYSLLGFNSHAGVEALAVYGATPGSVEVPLLEDHIDRPYARQATTDA